MLEKQRVRQLRQEKKLSIKELSVKSGISVSMISQVERGNVNITLTTLYKLCKGLDVPISTILQDSKESIRVVKKNNRRKVVFPDSQVKYELLTPNPNGMLETILVELEPGQNDRQLVEHNGEECGYVIEGTLTVILDDKEYILEKGDSIFFSSSTPHRFLNNSNEKCISLWSMAKK